MPTRDRRGRRAPSRSSWRPGRRAAPIPDLCVLAAAQASLSQHRRRAPDRAARRQASRDQPDQHQSEMGAAVVRALQLLLCGSDPPAVRVRSTGAHADGRSDVRAEGPRVAPARRLLRYLRGAVDRGAVAEVFLQGSMRCASGPARPCPELCGPFTSSRADRGSGSRTSSTTAGNSSAR
jgi:hypothetical protein